MATAIYVPCLAINAAVGGQIPLTTMIVVLGSNRDGLHGDWRGARGHLERRDAILRALRRPRRRGVDCRGVGARRSPGDLENQRRGGKDHAHRTHRERRRRLVVARGQAFFEQPLNVVGIMCSLVFGRMASYTSDQIMVQRLQTTKSLADARRAFIVNAAGDAIWMFALSFVGLALFAYFQVHALPAGLRDRQDPAVLRVADVSGRHRRPGDRVDHGGLAVERRLGDQLVYVGGDRRLLSTASCWAAPPRAAMPSINGVRCRFRGLARSCSGRPARCWP